MAVKDRDRQSDIEITLIDMDKAIFEFYEKLREDGKTPEGVTGMRTISTKWGYAKTPKGIYLLNNEGCGPDDPIDSEGVGLELFYERSDGRISIIPEATAKVSKEDVLEMDVLGTENFGAFVRKFGHRLEQNFHNWNSHLQSEIDAGQQA